MSDLADDIYDAVTSYVDIPDHKQDAVKLGIAEAINRHARTVAVSFEDGPNAVEFQPLNAVSLEHISTGRLSSQLYLRPGSYVLLRVESARVIGKRPSDSMS